MREQKKDTVVLAFVGAQSATATKPEQKNENNSPPAPVNSKLFWIGAREPDK
jgi:hypothetical protein